MSSHSTVTLVLLFFYTIFSWKFPFNGKLRFYARPINVSDFSRVSHILTRLLRTNRNLEQGLPRLVAAGECMANEFCRDHG